MRSKEDSMKPLERLADRGKFRSGLIALGAMTCLALSSACEQPVGVAVSAANADAESSATSAAGETNGTAIRPFRVNVPDADVADLKRRLAATRYFPTTISFERRRRGPAVPSRV
jgi:hypothetical protein